MPRHIGEVWWVCGGSRSFSFCDDGVMRAERDEDGGRSGERSDINRSLLYHRYQYQYIIFIYIEDIQ